MLTRPWQGLAVPVACGAVAGAGLAALGVGPGGLVALSIGAAFIVALAQQTLP